MRPNVGHCVCSPHWRPPEDESLTVDSARVTGGLRGEPRADELSDDQDPAVRDMVRRLNQLLTRWCTPEPIRAYRGLRSRVGLDIIGDVPLVTRSFLSTAIVRDVAVSEFTMPKGPGGPNRVLADSLREDGLLAENVSNKLSNEPPRTESASRRPFGHAHRDARAHTWIVMGHLGATPRNKPTRLQLRRFQHRLFVAEGRQPQFGSSNRRRPVRLRLEGQLWMR